MNISANSAPAGKPTTSMRFQTASCGRQNRESKWTYFSSLMKYQPSRTMPTTMAIELAKPAPAAPIA
jgi:hypothetical protein